MSALSEEDANLVKTYFNGMNTDHDSLGDILFGDSDDFNETVTQLSLEDKKEYVSALFEYGIIEM